MINIKDFPDHFINAKGDVFSYKTKSYKKLKQHIDNQGYKAIRLCHNGKSKLFRIHRIISETYIENEHNYPCVNHIDGDKLNNNIGNLEWCTYSENNQHAFDNGLKIPTFKKLNLLQVSIIKHLFNDFKDPIIANIFNVTRETIRDIRIGKTRVNHNFNDWKKEIIV